MTERLAAALDSMLDLVVLERAIRDEEGRVVDFRIEYANDSAGDFAGRRVADLVGERVLDAYPGMAGSEMFAGYVRVVETGEPLVVDSMPYEDIVDGKPVRGWWALRVSRFEDGILISTRDVTDQERPRRDLEASRVLLEAAQRLAHIGSWRWDLVTGELEPSREMLRITGVDPDAPLTNSAVFDRLVGPEKRDRLTAIVDDAANLDGAFEFETVLIRPNGEQREVIAHGEVELGDDGAPIAILGTAQDVTDRRTAEAELARERGVAELLQRTLLPEDLPEVPGVELDGYYRPAGEGTSVGGDWYDAFVLPDGRIGLAVGDVAGHGLVAAGRMGQLRSALRAYAFDGRSPAAVVAALDALLQQTDRDGLATCVYATFDPDTGDLVTACAGHPPVVVRGDEVDVRWGYSGPPLGAGNPGAYSDRSTVLAPGAIVLMYTDGLVERRDEDIDAGIRRLAAAITAWSDEHVAGIGEALASELAADVAVDDLCTLALRRS